MAQKIGQDLLVRNVEILSPLKALGGGSRNAEKPDSRRIAAMAVDGAEYRLQPQCMIRTQLVVRVKEAAGLLEVRGFPGKGGVIETAPFLAVCGDIGTGQQALSGVRMRYTCSQFGAAR